eukprot:118743-Prorocentrum_minimum.AAC.1
MVHGHAWHTDVLWSRYVDRSDVGRRRVLRARHRRTRLDIAQPKPETRARGSSRSGLDVGFGRTGRRVAAPDWSGRRWPPGTGRYVCAAALPPQTDWPPRRSEWTRRPPIGRRRA